jgi:hypothetical protein
MLPLRSSERGSAIAVVLIVTIMLLLAFVAMWFMQSDDLEKAQNDAKVARLEKNRLETAVAAFRDYAEKLSRLVGWANVNPEDVLPPGDANDPASPRGQGYGGNAVFSNLAAVEAQLRPDGVVDGAPGLQNFLKNTAFVEIAADARTGKDESVKQDTADFGWMKPEFKAKLGEYAKAMEAVSVAPKPPIDPDDAAARAEYEAELKQFEEQMAKVRAISDELAGMEGYKRFNEVISSGGRVVVDEQGIVKLTFYAEGAEPAPSIQSLLKSMEPFVNRMKAELVENKKADMTTKATLESEKKALEESLATTKGELKAEQDRHTTDVQNLQKELTDANAKVESNRVEATTALNKAQQLEEEMKRKETSLTREIQARDERIRQEKSRRDLQIRRDDKDGDVTATSPTMRTATISLGSSDRVFVGLKFGVSTWGRGGQRERKGEVVVTRVTGPHSAQVSILGETDAQSPIVQGDFVHNPLYSPTEDVNVVIVGTLQKWPKTILVDRLRRLGVTVQDQMDGKTDYVVVPDSMSAPLPTGAPAEGEEGADAPKPGQSELEKIQSQARGFGAVVITESMLDSFLNF